MDARASRWRKRARRSSSSTSATSPRSASSAGRDRAGHDPQPAERGRLLRQQGPLRGAQGGRCTTPSRSASRASTLDDIYLGNGASELIAMACNALLNDGDEVLMPAPDYPLWTAVGQPVGRHAGALPVRRGERLAARPRRHPRQDHAAHRAHRRHQPEQPDRRALSGRAAREHRRDRARARPDRSSPTRSTTRCSTTAPRTPAIAVARRRRAVRSPSTACRRTTAPAATAPAGWWSRATSATPRDYIEGLNMLAIDAPVRERAGPVRDPDRARRLPEHQRPGRARRPAAPPARPGLRAASPRFPASPASSRRRRSTCSRRLDPKVYPIEDDQQFASSCSPSRRC